MILLLQVVSFSCAVGQAPSLAAAAVMAHDEDLCVPGFSGFLQRLRAFACQPAHRRDLEPAVRYFCTVQFVKFTHIEQDEFFV